MKQIPLHQRLVYYSPEEELANRLSHGFGALLSLVGLVALLLRAGEGGETYRIVSVGIYGTIMVVFYCLSTTYHTVSDPRRRYLFRILDHASIYLMIAGTYTPFTLVTLRDGWGWNLFGIVWSLAAAGVVFKIFMTHRLRILGPLLYIALGWIVVLDYPALAAALAPTGLVLLFAGGVLYTVGVAFYAWGKLPFNHAIWHGFVLLASACHYLAIYAYVLPLPG